MNRSLFVASCVLVGCTAQAVAVPPSASSTAQRATSSVPDSSLSAARAAVPPTPRTQARAPSAWRDAYDFDGDGKKDEVVSEYSGGAHCCYHVGVQLSSTQTTLMLPFDLDGGYVYPEDLPDHPERFAISESSAGIAELVLEIETYNGEPQPLPVAWTKQYGISSHRVVVSFIEGRVRVRDFAVK